MLLELSNGENPRHYTYHFSDICNMLKKQFNLKYIGADEVHECHIFKNNEFTLDIEILIRSLKNLRKASLIILFLLQELLQGQHHILHPGCRNCFRRNRCNECRQQSDVLWSVLPDEKVWQSVTYRFRRRNNRCGGTGIFPIWYISQSTVKSPTCVWSTGRVRYYPKDSTAAMSRSISGSALSRP